MSIAAIKNQIREVKEMRPGVLAFFKKVDGCSPGAAADEVFLVVV